MKDIQDLRNLVYGYKSDEKNLRQMIKEMNARADTMIAIALDIEKMIDAMEDGNAPGKR